MSEEQDVQAELVKRFPALAEKVRVQRVRRILADVPADLFGQVFDSAIKELNFSILCTITGLDEGPTLGVIYHLARLNGIVLNLKMSVPKEAPVVQTVTAYFPAAEMYEREMVDLLGMDVRGLQPGHRYPLPDSFPADQHPLRKDWKPAATEPEAKTGA